MEVPFDVSHTGQLRLIKQSLCTNCSEFTWGGQYTHFITFCQRAQWNLCGTLFLCMSLSMEFLIVDVVTRSLLMSFVKDNYRLREMDREGMKSWLCVLLVDVAMRPLLLTLTWVWPLPFVQKFRPQLYHHRHAWEVWSTFAPHITACVPPAWSQCTRYGTWNKATLLLPFSQGTASYVYHIPYRLCRVSSLVCQVSD